MKFKIRELLDDAKALQLKSILERLQAQDAADLPNAEVVRKCLLEVKPIQELGARNSSKDAETIKQIMVLAKAILDRAKTLGIPDNPDEETPDSGKGGGTPPAKKTPESKVRPDGSSGSRVSEVRLEDFVSLPNLQEATVSAGGQSVEVVLIEEGWSMNNRYYPRGVLEKLPMLLGNSRKVFLNHLMTKAQQEAGRDMKQWAAQIEEVQLIESGKNPGKVALAGKIHVFDKPDGWLQERILKYPNEVGLSISAFATLKEGEAEGRKGQIVEEVRKVESFDFVDRPAAGGRVLRIAAGVDLDRVADLIENETVESLPEEIREALKSSLIKIQKRKELSEKREEFYDITYALGDAIREIANMDVQAPDQAKLLEQTFDEFRDLMLQLPLVDMFKSNVKETLTKKEESEEVEFSELTLTELAVKRPDLIDQLKEGWEEEQKDSEQAKEKDARLNALAEENKTLREKIETGEAEKRAKERVDLVTAKVAEAELPDWVVDEQFRSDLVNAKDVAEIDLRIKKAKDILEKAVSAGGVKGNGPDTVKEPLKAGEPKTEEKQIDEAAIVNSAFA